MEKRSSSTLILRVVVAVMAQVSLCSGFTLSPLAFRGALHRTYPRSTEFAKKTASAKRGGGGFGACPAPPKSPPIAAPIQSNEIFSISDYELPKGFQTNEAVVSNEGKLISSLIELKFAPEFIC
jgi:hypothetical protein